MTKLREGYKETEIGVIPEEWEVVKQGDISTFYNGRAYKQTEFRESGTPIIRIQNLTGEGKYVYSDLSLENNKYIEKDDLIYAWSATFGPYIWNGPKGIYHYHIWKIECLDNLDKMFYYYRLNQISSELGSKKNGSVFAHITKGFMENHLIGIPPLPEQQRIAEILSTTDEHIEKLDKTIEDYQLLKKGMMKKLLTEGIGHTEFKDTEIGRIPKEWEVKKLSDLCKVITKQTGFDYTATIKPSLLTEFNTDTLPFLQTKNFKGSTISLVTDYYIPKSIAQNFPKILLDEKCMLFSIVGASVGNVGLFSGDETAFLGGAICVVKFIDVKDVDFSYYVMQSDIGQKQIKFYTKGAGQATITIEDIRVIKIPVPSMKERDQIANFLENLDERINQFTRERQDFIQLKKALMEQLLTGKIRVNQ